MEWYNILTMVLGALGTFGGIGGAISIYQAKSNKQTIDVGNFKKMLDEAQEMYDAANEEKKEYIKEFYEYRVENAKYVAEFKKRFSNIESRLQQTEKAVSQAYRCTFPPDIKDCPVLQEYEKSHCLNCIGNAEHNNN